MPLILLALLLLVLALVLARWRRQRQGASPPPRFSAGELLLVCLPFPMLFLGMLLVWVTLRPAYLAFLLGDAPTPEALLRGYSAWYLGILLALGSCVFLPGAGAVIALARGRDKRASLRLSAVCLFLPLFIGIAMITMEDLPGLFTQARADLAQVESGSLQEVTVWLSPKCHPYGLPGPYAEGQPQPTIQYGGISEQTGGVWERYYVPDSLGFALDPDALYDENQSIQWNEEHARQYRLRYTDNFHLVVSVEPVP